MTQRPGQRPHCIAFFVSPHGFGHATRAAAVMAAAEGLRPGVRFEIFTTAPSWLFAETLRGPFGYHETLTDVGLVQLTPLREDVRQTVEALDALYPLAQARVDELAVRLQELGCRLVVCDIAPLGIAVAHRAGLRAVLQENFTWDWIYAPYLDEHPAFGRHAAYLRDLFATADFHVQTVPACRPGPADLVASPVGRAPRLSRSAQRRALGVSDTDPLVLVSMKGISREHAALARARDFPSVRFLVPSHVPAVRADGNVILLPWSDEFFHPDLIQASDAVVSKLGYSTLAEVYRSGAPFGYVLRSRFPENGPLRAFVEERMSGLPLTARSFESGDWMTRLPELLSLPRSRADGPDGAVQVARSLIGLIEGAGSGDRGGA
jgi:hypothetical protein